MKSTRDKLLEAYRDWLHITPEQIPPDHYTVLGLPRFVHDEGRLKEAIQERVRIVRPRCLKYPELGTALLNEIAAAGVCLGQRQSREAYDAALQAGGVRATLELAASPAARKPARALPVAVAIPGDLTEADVDALLPPGLRGGFKAEPAVEADADIPLGIPVGIPLDESARGAASIPLRRPAPQGQANNSEKQEAATPHVHAASIRMAAVARQIWQSTRTGYGLLAQELGHAGAIASCLAATALLAVVLVIAWRSLPHADEALPVAAAAAAPETPLSAEPNPGLAAVKIEAEVQASEEISPSPVAMPPPANPPPEAQPALHTYVGRLVKVERRQGERTCCWRLIFQRTNRAWQTWWCRPMKSCRPGKGPFGPSPPPQHWSRDLADYESAEEAERPPADVPAAPFAGRSLAAPPTGGDQVAAAVALVDQQELAKLLSRTLLPHSELATVYKLVAIQRIGEPDSLAQTGQTRPPLHHDLVRMARRSPLDRVLRAERGTGQTHRLRGTISRNFGLVFFWPADSPRWVIVKPRPTIGFSPFPTPALPVSGQVEADVFFTGDFADDGTPQLEMITRMSIP